MNISDFDYDLPEELIAQEPVEPRDASRLMVLNRQTQQIEHRLFRDIYDYLNPGDVLVLNDTRVIPARLHGERADTGGKLEVLLLRQLNETDWHVLIGGKRAETGMSIRFNGGQLTADVIDMLADAERVIRFSQPVDDLLDELGEMPLPPYIHAPLTDQERYQTIYSRNTGSAAAPTAGLHFTPDLLLAAREHGVQLAFCTLTIGLDTFQPVRVDQITEHRIHSESARLTSENARIINDAKLAGGRIVAVGTTTARTLETAAILSAGGDPSQPKESEDRCPWRPVIAFEQDTDLFIYPGYKWRAVDAMVTNFHLPRSTLLMMIGSYTGMDLMRSAYEAARQERYRFYSFGDAMLML